MRNIDCFAFRGSDENRGKCDVTVRKDCAGCPFFKTRTQFDEDKAAAVDILQRKRLRPCEKTSVMFGEHGNKKEICIISVKPV